MTDGFKKMIQKIDRMKTAQPSLRQRDESYRGKIMEFESTYSNSDRSAVSRNGLEEELQPRQELR